MRAPTEIDRPPFHCGELGRIRPQFAQSVTAAPPAQRMPGRGRAGARYPVKMSAPTRERRTCAHILSRSSRSARSRFLPATDFIAIRSSREQTQTELPSTSVATARLRRPSKLQGGPSPGRPRRTRERPSEISGCDEREGAGAEHAGGIILSRPSSVSIVTCSAPSNNALIPGSLLTSDSPCCACPCTSTASFASLARSSPSLATTMSTSLVPRTTPQALSAKPPTRTKSTPASTSLRSSSSKAASLKRRVRLPRTASACGSALSPLQGSRSSAVSRLHVGAEPSPPRSLRQQPSASRSSAPPLNRTADVRR